MYDKEITECGQIKLQCPFLVSEQTVIVNCSTGSFSQNRLSFTGSGLHSLCQECIRKFPGQTLRERPTLHETDQLSFILL